MDKLQENESFFVEGSGKAVIAGDNGKVSLVHLQDCTMDLGCKMEEIFGGEGNFALYSFPTEKSAKFTFKNASMSLDLIKTTQGVDGDKKVVVFNSETVTVGADGTITPSKQDIETDSLVVSQNGSIIALTDGKAPEGVFGQKVDILYRYTMTDNAVGASVLTTSVPGFVTIYHESKPLKQKNGRVVKIYTTIYKARSDGQLKMDMKQKNAYAPELVFNAVDPEREDGRFVSFAVVDVTPAK